MLIHKNYSAVAALTKVVGVHNAEQLKPSTKPACHQRRLPPPANTTVSNCFHRKASKDRVFINGWGDLVTPRLTRAGARWSRTPGMKMPKAWPVFASALNRQLALIAGPRISLTDPLCTFYTRGVSCPEASLSRCHRPFFPARQLLNSLLSPLRPPH